MRIYDNGTYRDMTPEEVAAMEDMAAQDQVHAPVPTAEERLEALEAALKKGLSL